MTGESPESKQGRGEQNIDTSKMTPEQWAAKKDYVLMRQELERRIAEESKPEHRQYLDKIDPALLAQQDWDIFYKFLTRQISAAEITAWAKEIKEAIASADQIESIGGLDLVKKSLAADKTLETRYNFALYLSDYHARLMLESDETDQFFADKQRERRVF